MLPGPLSQAVIAGQRIGVGTDVSRSLHVIVTAENVGAATGYADIAKRQLQNARGAHDGVACSVLGLAHAPDDGRRTVLGHHLGSHVDPRFGHAAGLFDLVGRPLGKNFFLDLVHAVNAVVDVFGVFPAVFEDVIQHAKEEWNV